MPALGFARPPPPIPFGFAPRPFPVAAASEFKPVVVKPDDETTTTAETTTQETTVPTTTTYETTINELESQEEESQTVWPNPILNVPQKYEIKYNTQLPNLVEEEFEIREVFPQEYQRPEKYQPLPRLAASPKPVIRNPASNAHVPSNQIDDSSLVRPIKTNLAQISKPKNHKNIPEHVRRIPANPHHHPRKSIELGPQPLNTPYVFRQRSGKVKKGQLKKNRRQGSSWNPFNLFNF